MVTPDQRRAVADSLRQERGASQRRVSRLLGVSRSIPRYRHQPREGEPALVEEIQRPARAHPRFGRRRIHAMPVREGWSVNVKRVHRLWGELGRKRPVRPRKPRKPGAKPGSNQDGRVNRTSRLTNDVWTCDFIHDRTSDGRPLKWLAPVDAYARELLVPHAGESMTGEDVRREIALVIKKRGAPNEIRSDNGSGFVCALLTSWLTPRGSNSIPVTAGHPWEDGSIDSFHSRLRDEFLERVEFESVADAQAQGDWSRREYNAIRPRGSPNYLTKQEGNLAPGGSAGIPIEAAMIDQKIEFSHR